MATANYAYQNRCIVVTDEDYEEGNIPPLSDERSKNDNRNYPSSKLAVSDDFNFWDIVITSGYYENSCIDYIDNEVSVEDWLGGTQCYGSQSVFFSECKFQFGLSFYRLRKICGNIGNIDIETYLDEAYEKLTDYLRKKEEEKVNAYLDSVKNLYLYDEITCIGRASNGEAFYKKIV